MKTQKSVESERWLSLLTFCTYHHISSALDSSIYGIIGIIILLPLKNSFKLIKFLTALLHKPPSTRGSGGGVISYQLQNLLEELHLPFLLPSMRPVVMLS